MGVFDRLFGKKETDSRSPLANNSSDKRLPIQGPAPFVQAAEMQRDYWTHSAEEQAGLESIGIDKLEWPDLLRLHHLLCLERVCKSSQGSNSSKCGQTTKRLLALDSPYRSRPALIWQGEPQQQEKVREPDMQGTFRNASVTHFGCLECYRLDDANTPSQIFFASFDELVGVMFAPQSLLRPAKLFYEGGKFEVVLVPLLYGLTWEIGDDADRSASMTRFVAHLATEDAGDAGPASGIGVGQQDFVIQNEDHSGSLFGLGSISEISFPLDMRDLRFDEKARSRGIDPHAVRERVAGR